MPARPITQQDFSGGMNAVANPFLLTRKQVRDARNLLLHEHGSLTVRPGYKVLSVSPDLANAVVYRGVLVQSTGLVAEVAIQRGTVNTLYQTNTTPWTKIGDFGTPELIPDAAIVDDKLFLANGYEVPRVWDGSVFSAITAQATQTLPPGAKHVLFHFGAVWIWNTAPASSNLDGPSSLRMSNFAASVGATPAPLDKDNPFGKAKVSDWPTSNQTFVSKDDGQEGMGGATYTIAETGISPRAAMVLFKNFSCYQVDGVFGSTNFGIQKIKSDMGCIAPRTIQFVSGFGIIRLGHKGFALYNGVDDRLISEEVRPFLFGNEDHAGLNFQAVLRSWASQSQTPPLYIAACPVAGATTLTRLFVFDLIRRGWTIADLPIPIQCLSLFFTPTVAPVVHAGTATGGRIVRLFSGDLTDDGALIGWSAKTKPETSGSQTRPSYFQRAILDVTYRSSQQVQITATPVSITPTGESKLVATRSVLTSPIVGSAYGAAKYGTAVYGASTFRGGRVTIPVHRQGSAMYLDITGRGQAVIRGLEWHIKPKPITRVRV